LRGLRLFRSVLETRDQEQLSKTMRRCMRDWGDIEGSLLFLAQTIWRSDPWIEEGVADARKEILRHAGDRHGWPNLAWVVMWNAEHFNGYGGGVDPSLKLSGFVFWDAGRMTTSLRAAIERSRETTY